MTAKSNEANIFFKIHFVVSMNLENLPTKAFLKIIPKTISIMNKSNKYTFWKENILRTETTKKEETPVEEILEEPGSEY